MKNLKKVLALGLALVMLLGMFTVASAAETKKVATDLTDFDKVVNKEAVSLMVDLGVIKGMPDGSYAPANTIDRASWSKMVYYVLTNEEDASVYVPAAPVFTDVTDQHWACGEIAYLKTLGIVAGDGTSFRPNDEITMVEAFKMMLTGIGYDAKYEKFENDANWAGNVMKMASRLGLTDKISAKQTDKLTRDVAAQIVYNALGCNVKELDEKQIGNIGTMVDGYKTYGTLGYENFKIADTVSLVTSVDEDGVAVLSNAKLTNVKASAANVGRRVRVWCNVTKDVQGNYQYNSAKSSFAFPAEDTAAKVVTGGIDDITKAFTSTDKDNYIGFPANTVTADDDTVSQSVKYVMDGVSKANAAAVKADAAKAGNKVEFYDDDGDGDIDTVWVTTYAPKKISSSIKTRTNGDDKLEVSVPGVFSGYVLADRVIGYAGLEKDDIVLVNTSYIGADQDVAVYTITKPESISGKVSGNSSDGKITINGTKYEMSGTVTSVDSCSDFSAWNEYDNEYAFYLDIDGKICYAVVTEEGIDTSKVALVLESKFVEGGDIDVANNMRAKLLFTDGTTEIVTVSKVNGDKIVKSGASTDEVNADNALTVEEIFYNYKVDKDGKYELTEMNATEQSGKWEAIVTETGAPEITNKPAFAVGKDTLGADTKTLFIVAKLDKDDNATYYTYTGHTNVPKMNQGAATLITAATEDGASAAKYVYIKTTAFADDKPEGMIFVRDTKYSYNNADGCYEINIVDAKGNATTLKVDKDFTIGDNKAVSTWNSSGLNDVALNLYTIESVADGVVTKLAAAATESNKVVNTQEIKLGNGVVTLDKAYEITDSTVMVWIDLKADKDTATTPVYGSCGTFAAGDSLDTGAEVYPSGIEAWAMISDGVADFVYVVRDGSAK